VDEDQRRDVLLAAEDKLRRVSRELGSGSTQAQAHRQRLLDLERSTAAVLGLPYAQRVSVGVAWGAGTPTPILLLGLRTFVIFYKGTRPVVTVRELAAEPGAIVEFKRMTSVKIGPPNAEGLHGHALWGSGLELYSAHEVNNSPWITELMRMESTDEHINQDQWWSGNRHYILTFHNKTLECVAKWTITRTAPGATMPEVIARLSAEAL
jgi:hypothetical protein